LFRFIHQEYPMNYKHLHYFWRVAHAGSIARASELSHVTPQTISEQLHELEESLGVKLFERRGRRLELTETGTLALSYADRIFAMGAEAQAVLRGVGSAGSVHFRVGIADVVPKALAYRFIEPAVHIGRAVHLTAREWKLADLLAELAVHRLDMVVADTPIPAGMSVRAFNHRLGDSGLSFFASAALAAELSAGFPRSLHARPFLMPGQDSAVHGRLLQWFEVHTIEPDLIAEFDDAALMNAFGTAGLGVFAAPSVLRDDLSRQYAVQEIGRTRDIRQEFFVISVQRRDTHPCVKAVLDSAQSLLSHNAARPPVPIGRNTARPKL
jgi:LysR family transcriptional activator of nhaA